METPAIHEPPEPLLSITPNSASVSISSGQSVSIDFTVHKTYIIGQVSLSVGTLPQGIAAAFSGPIIVGGSGQAPFTLTLTAALNATPVLATIQVTASASNADDANASVTLNATATGQVYPRYQILTVLYAPPGTNGGKSSSQVSYGGGSTTGTTDSTSDSYKTGVDVTASVGGDIGPVSLGASADFTASQTSGETSQIQINKGANNQINVSGPAQDGINHGNDLYYLWLNPQLNVAISHLGDIAWDVGVNGPDMLIQYIYTEWLQNPSMMPPGVAQALANAGLTAADYAQILACNPFSSGGTAIDPNRFVLTTQSFPYEPPLAAGDPVPTKTYAQTSATTTTNAEQVQVQYGVSVSLSAGIKAPITASLKVTDSLQWTNTSTSTEVTGSSQSASVTVGGPAFGYTGPTNVQVYWDTVFSSWMFAFVTESPSVSGTVTDSAGNPIANQAVTLTVGGTTLSTFTSSSGGYNFYGGPQGQGTIAVANHEFTVAVGSNEPKRTLQV
jgi:Carboxypeptidase regulatory-like domain